MSGRFLEGLAIGVIAGAVISEMVWRFYLKRRARPMNREAATVRFFLATWPAWIALAAIVVSFIYFP